jgi:hypothetical protein
MRIACLPDEKKSHLRYVCSYISSQPIGIRTMREISLINQYRAINDNIVTVNKFASARDAFFITTQHGNLEKEIKEAAEHSQKMKWSDPFLPTLDNYLQGVMRHAKVHWVGRMYRLPRIR